MVVLKVSWCCIRAPAARRHRLGLRRARGVCTTRTPVRFAVRGAGYDTNAVDPAKWIRADRKTVATAGGERELWFAVLVG
jgi:hypothetical protein